MIYSSFFRYKPKVSLWDSYKTTPFCLEGTFNHETDYLFLELIKDLEPPVYCGDTLNFKNVLKYFLRNNFLKSLSVLSITGIIKTLTKIKNWAFVLPWENILIFKRFSHILAHGIKSECYDILCLDLIYYLDNNLNFSPDRLKRTFQLIGLSKFNDYKIFLQQIHPESYQHFEKVFSQYGKNYYKMNGEPQKYSFCLGTCFKKLLYYLSKNDMFFTKSNVSDKVVFLEWSEGIPHIDMGNIINFNLLEDHLRKDKTYKDIIKPFRLYKDKLQYQHYLEKRSDSLKNLFNNDKYYDNFFKEMHLMCRNDIKSIKDVVIVGFVGRANPFKYFQVFDCNPNKEISWTMKYSNNVKNKQKLLKSKFHKYDDGDLFKCLKFPIEKYCELNKESKLNNSKYLDDAFRLIKMNFGIGSRITENKRQLRRDIYALNLFLNKLTIDREPFKIKGIYENKLCDSTKRAIEKNVNKSIGEMQFWCFTPIFRIYKCNNKVTNTHCREIKNSLLKQEIPNYKKKLDLNYIKNHDRMKKIHLELKNRFKVLERFKTKTQKGKIIKKKRKWDEVLNEMSEGVSNKVRVVSDECPLRFIKKNLLMSVLNNNFSYKDVIDWYKLTGTLIGKYSSVNDKNSKEFLSKRRLILREIVDDVKMSEVKHQRALRRLINYRDLNTVKYNDKKSDNIIIKTDFHSVRLKLSEKLFHLRHTFFKITLKKFLVKCLDKLKLKRSIREDKIKFLRGKMKGVVRNIDLRLKSSKTRENLIQFHDKYLNDHPYQPLKGCFKSKNSNELLEKRIFQIKFSCRKLNFGFFKKLSRKGKLEVLFKYSGSSSFSYFKEDLIRRCEEDPDFSLE